MALQVVDRTMQSFGAEGISQDTTLAQTWAGLRTLRFADVCLTALPLEYDAHNLHRRVPMLFVYPCHR